MFSLLEEGKLKIYKRKIVKLSKDLKVPLDLRDLFTIINIVTHQI